MDVSPLRQELITAVLSDRSDAEVDRIIRQYYKDTDFVVAPEGILKLLSAIVCIASAVLLLSLDTCDAAGASSLMWSAAILALSCGATTALLYSALVLKQSLLAPRACLFIDIVLSTSMGLLLLIMFVLTMTACDMRNFVSYVNGPLGIASASMLLCSAVITYVSVMRRWDQARSSSELTRPPSQEQDA